MSKYAFQTQNQTQNLYKLSKSHFHAKNKSKSALNVTFKLKMNEKSPKRCLNSQNNLRMFKCIFQTLNQLQNLLKVSK